MSCLLDPEKNKKVALSCTLVSAHARKRDPHGTACMSHYIVSWCRAEPVALLIKASLSRVSGSFSLSADFFPRSAARTASGFHQQRWSETFC